MSHDVHVVGHSGLRIVEIVHEDIHNVPKPVLYHKLFVNFRCRMYCIFTPVGDSRLPSAVTDLFTIKILNSLLVETLSANE